MALTLGTRLGVYEVTAQLGVGGMGEVYRATDTRLKRQVAIKILPPSLATDAGRLARFQREAEVLASLNHPNIAAIYGVEDSGGLTALVMELVEGEDLSQRIARGPIPIDEALPIARQIAEALEAAHEQGIIHRDLKPANIKVRADGTVKVLDFGLAKAMDPVGSAPNVSQSPTITTPAMMTGVGVILGTAAYMSPEQTKGHAADKRSDVWAFGCVLYEMLTGRQVFSAETVVQVLASVLKDTPDWTALPADTPAPIRRLLRRCLERDRKKRLTDAAHARLEIEEALASPAEETSQAHAPLARELHTTFRRQNSRLRWALAGVAVVAAAAIAGLWSLTSGSRTAPEVPMLRGSLPLPRNSLPGFVAISPDGGRVVVSLSDPSVPNVRYRLAMRPLDGSAFMPLADSEGARGPFWSPDGRFIGFFADGQRKLRVIPASGGRAQSLCDATGNGSAGTWHPSGVILFTDDNRLYRSTFANGTEPVCERVAGAQDDQWVWRAPEFLPDGRHFLYFGGPQPGLDDARRGLYLASLDSPVGKRLLNDLTSAVYAPGRSGEGAPFGTAHILFLRNTTLMAQAFDDRTLELSGDPFPVAERVSTTLSPPEVAASVAANGTLVYVADSVTQLKRAVWMDRLGNTVESVGPAARQRAVNLSLDGNALTVIQEAADGLDTLWLRDLTRPSDNRMLPTGTRSSPALWSRDASALLFRARLSAGDGIYKKTVTSGAEELLFTPVNNGSSPSDWSRDGRYIVYTEHDPKTRADIWYVPVDDGQAGKPVAFLATGAQESQGQLSPDGKWIAYVSDESSRYQVYLRSFPSGVAKKNVSSGTEGREPRWARDGTELFFVENLNYVRSRLMRVSIDVAAAGGPAIGQPQKLFEYQGTVWSPAANSWSYSPHPDGKRFLVLVAAEAQEPTLNVIINWRKAAQPSATR